ncbi:VWA domain-containing protein [Actinopolyspora erythraea]|uniref:VWA domain-containing protein n=1 Tax=Actinopolyspora erythraea TaxID=414996 RepID=A0A099D269_9ACTN|nr:VWA domain-containing protein [Actinopolyspora erythraea]ASU77359.1 VWA domain-containing protein [Actinopolyspora erythraea]KGI80144.1 von Willebrand factor A [Actinopolyspora erythraea]
MREADNTLEGLVGFARALRHSGMRCGPARVRSFLDATEHVDFADRDQLYWAGRLTLCSDPDDLPRFDAAFHAWFGRLVDSPEPGREQRRRVRSRALPLGGEEPESAESVEAEQLAAAGDVEVLHRRDLAELSEDERAHLRRMIAWLDPRPPRRTALRWHRSRDGRLDPGGTMRAMIRGGGEPVRLVRRTRGERPRKVVLLIDVSGSMSPYADALLRFAHVVVRAAPSTTEVFTLGTRLTRVTRQLRQRDPEFALTAAGRAVPDFSGGTRLGSTLRAFLDRWGRRGAARQAVVVLFSDGWERGDTGELAEQMRGLRRLAHAVLWANPHAGHEGYEPVQSGIAAALPHVDGLVAGHSLAALRELWRRVRSCSESASPARSAGEPVEVSGA